MEFVQCREMVRIRIVPLSGDITTICWAVLQMINIHTLVKFHHQVHNCLSGSHNWVHFLIVLLLTAEDVSALVGSPGSNWDNCSFL